MEELELCFPLMPNRSCRLPRVQPSQNLLIQLVLGGLSVVITVLNLLVILSIACFRELQSSSHRILLSLAISDLLVGLVLLPVSTQTWGVCWLWGDFACVLYYYLTTTLIMASVGTVVLISVDRYIAVVNPMLYQRRMSLHKVNLSICLTWSYAVLFCFITMNGVFTSAGHRCLGQCAIGVLVEADILLAWVVPFGIIVVLYIHIFAVVIVKIRARTSEGKQRAEFKAARNLGSVVAAHVICYIPYYSVAYSGGAAIEIQSESAVVVSSIMIYLNSAVNPLIYVLIYPNFRKAFRAIVSLKVLHSGPGNL